MARKSNPPDSPEVADVVGRLRRMGTRATKQAMARYAIPSDRAFGVGVGALQKMARSLGRNHRLAAGLWATGWYEARMLATMIDEPSRVTPAQMDRWARDFDNWAICDTACFKLFDRTPHAFGRVRHWAKSQDEFVKRGAFALLASLAGHDRTSGDERFERCLPLIERAASDERNFVKKGVSWALRGIGRRKSPRLKAAALALARRLSESDQPAARWVGKDAVRDLTRRR